jgi:hypothetical protein
MPAEIAVNASGEGIDFQIEDEQGQRVQFRLDRRCATAHSNWRLPMPVFHFNSFTDGEVLPDVEGEELSNVDVAREVAEKSAREALIEAVKTGDTAPDCIQVTDSEGREVLTVILEDLLDG